KIQGNTILGSGPGANTIGVRIDGGIVDLGQTGPGTDITGLGVSTGGNDFTGFTTSSATSGAIVVAATDRVAGPQGLTPQPADIPAFGNIWTPTTVAGKEAAVWHDPDVTDGLVRFVDFGTLSLVGTVSLTTTVVEGSDATFHIEFDNDAQEH